MILLLQCNPRTLTQVERARIASITQGQAHGVLWRCKSSSCFAHQQHYACSAAHGQYVCAARACGVCWLGRLRTIIGACDMAMDAAGGRVLGTQTSSKRVIFVLCCSGRVVTLGVTKADEREKSFSDGAPSPHRPLHVRASMACSMGNLALSRAQPCHPRRQPSRARAEHPMLSTCC